MEGNDDESKDFQRKLSARVITDMCIQFMSAIFSDRDG